jgi:hypothetical protein
MAHHFFFSNDGFLLRELKRKLEKRADISIFSHKDCKNLSEVLSQHGFHVSPMTLARCFGISPSAHRPFISTLDLLSKFLGYSSFYKFSAEVNDFIKFSLSRPELEFNTGDYSYSALEIALRVNNWDTARRLIDSYKGKYPSSMDFVWFLGNQVRNQNDKSGILKLLADTDNGRKYFFESFVDEDDPNGYFSKALLSYYKPKTSSLRDQLFLNAFLDAKRFYKNGTITKTSKRVYEEAVVNFHDFHFHQISRLFEIRILREAYGLNRISVIASIIDELLPLIKNFNSKDQRWLLIRPIKALVATNNFEIILLGNTYFKEEIESQYLSLEFNISSTADLALQYIIFSMPIFKHLIVSKPFRMQNVNLNDENARIILESATAAIVSTHEIGKEINKNLVHLAHSTEHSWVLQLLKD